MARFTHLHVHSHFSILDGMSKIPDLVEKCKRTGMYSMALTDHGNMFGIKELLDCCKKENSKVKDRIREQEALLNDDKASQDEKRVAEKKIESLKQTFFKPIVGIETYYAHTSRFNKDSRGWHLILLAKNKQGYENLCKLSTLAFTEGFYYNARIDNELIEKYHEGLICSTACLAGEIPQLILAGDMKKAEARALWFKNVFGEDFYFELMRHKTDKPNANKEAYEEQQVVNKALVALARKLDIKLIATNDVHFVEEEHAEAHDRLICISTQTDFDDPNRLHYSKQEWLKSPEEMAAAFADLPEALENTQEVADKVEVFDIDSDPIMPIYPIPESFGTEEDYRKRISPQELFDEFTRNENGEEIMNREAAEKKIKRLGGYDKLYRIKFEADYLEMLVREGARYRYGDTLNEEQADRIKFELHTIKTMGFPGYFLIVRDYIRDAREELHVSVGPGRGSAAGSVVAYCLRITDIDPLKYHLLFERFLNPDRISLPDIDVDFDDEGRGRVLDRISEKYGKERVAHIITYGVMAAKSAIADVCRIHKVPLSVANELKSYVPDRAFPDNVKDENGKTPKVNLHNCYKYVPELHAIMEGENEQLKTVLHYAEELEGTNRNIGIHACGVIIGADDLTNFAPLCTVKDKESGQDVLVTQYDGHVVENVGLIKMDFLGLSNLSIIKNCIETVKKTKGIEIDIDHIPVDDEETYQLYQEGNTVATFQFESAGMQQYLRRLKPTVFEDLIAMNALYRPGPMDYIPSFIDRKNGKEAIVYDLPEMEEYLKETYGITVYQEQVMLLSRKLAGFTRGESDTLRKAMGKKQIAKMLELKDKFLKQGEAKGFNSKILEKIWKDWEKFASYAFNKSHATCYAWVAYQTAYLKTHYPAEYMAAILTSARGNPDDLTNYLAECHRMGLEVLLPSINESDVYFTVNQQGQIRFGFSAIKGMGEGAAEAIIKERNEKGPFNDVFDLLSRMDMRAFNRKNLEVLAKSGALDNFHELHRAQYFHKESPAENAPSYCDALMRWAQHKQESEQAAQTSIFDMAEDLQEEDHPSIPVCEPWSNIERCRFEHEVIGFYLSGHPLDDFRLEMKSFATNTIADLKDLDKLAGRDFTIGCMVTSAKTGIGRSGKSYGIMTIEDYDDSMELQLWGKDSERFSNYCKTGLYLLISGTVRQFTHRNSDGTETKEPPRKQLSSMMELGNVLDEKTRSIHFHVPLEEISDAFCNELNKAAHRHKGKASVSMAVDDNSNSTSLNMSSIQMRVAPHDFIDALRQMPQVKNISLNGKLFA
ncbi:MAG: DNA polymerase III subunit alpha [Bacteroidales bacterium]|nr:DNA polymerase III subunit alpha [Bacteroidales bacterium]